MLSGHLKNIILTKASASAKGRIPLQQAHVQYTLFYFMNKFYSKNWKVREQF
jgi:hypothetical protein